MTQNDTRTNKLIAVLLDIFSSIVPNSSYDESKESGYAAKSEPYLAFELSELPKTDGKIPIVLEANVIGYGEQKALIEGYCDNIQSVLDEYDHLDESIQFTCYVGHRGKVQEDDKKIIRRRLTFELQLHERGGN